MRAARTTGLTAVVLALLLASSYGADTGSAAVSRLAVLPNPVRIWRPGTQERIVVEGVREDGTFVADLTTRAQLKIADPNIAIVQEGGIVKALAPGETTLAVSVDSMTVQVPVRVDPGPQPYVPSFRNDVIPVLTKAGCNSGACHGAAAGKGGLKLTLRGYDPMLDYHVLTRQARARRVDRREPGRSLILLKPTLTLPHGGGLRFEVGSTEYWILAEWIAAGAPAPTSKDPMPTRIAVLPEQVVLAPGDGQRFVVQAFYSDGTVRDVTRWCKFNSTELVVAEVSQDGVANVKGRGEATINATFGNLVAQATITVPFRTDLDEKLFTQAETRNFIDELVIKKLKTLGIPPSGLCSDREFIRRAYLDCTGTLPPPERVQAFVKDSSPDKREKLIAELLQSDEFVDYWSYWLSDLLLLSSAKLSRPALLAYYQWIRTAVAENMPWDEFARSIVTATGSNLENGAANYFVQHKDVVDLTETTSVTFLGTSITCARCHNHPLEKWTQDQYYRFANLFARVRLKDGKRSGEVIVYDAPDGEVRHPRRGVPMPPTPLDASPIPPDYPGTRREYLAEWMTSSDNKLFARTFVNRVWAALFGRGIVDPPDDLRATNPPANAELLDALADQFVSHGYDMRWLIQTIMSSATYQRSSVPTELNAFDVRWNSHYIPKRLAAEVLADAIAHVTGVPDTYPGYPKGTRAIQLPDVRVASYFLDVFGRPKREQPCACERMNDASIAQTLHLFNGSALNEKLRSNAGRVEKWLKEGVTLAEAIDRLYLLALARPASDAEKQALARLLGDGDEQPAKLDQPPSREQLEDLFWAVLTSKEFAFNH